MKILVAMPGKIGDALYATSSIRCLKPIWGTKHEDNVEIHWVYGSPMLTDFTTWLAAHTDLPVTRYIPRECPYTFGEIYGRHWDKVDWKAEYPGYDAYYNFAITKFPEPGYHLVEWIARGGGIKSESVFNPYLVCNTPSMNSAKNLILVHPWTPAPERQCKWLMHLKKEYCGYKVATIGLKDEPLIPETKDLRGSGYSLYIDLLRSAKLVVGIASSTAVISAVFGTPTIMMHGHSQLVGVAGIKRFGPHALDMVRPFVHDIDKAIENTIKGAQ